MEIDVQTVGLKTLSMKIRQREDQMSDMSPFWESVGEYMVKRADKCFAQEQAPDGTKWKPLSASRLKQRKGKRRGRVRILTDTGKLRRSIRYRAFKKQVTVMSSLPYASVHQFGSGNVPARPFLGITEGDRAKVLDMMKRYLRRNTG